MNFEIIIGAATLIQLVHRAPLYHRFLEALNLDVKPFNCIMCSTFWYTLVATVFTIGWPSIFISSTAAILAEWIDIKLNQL